MTYCNVTGRRRRWEIMLMPGDDPFEMVKEETLWRLVSPWISPAQASIERAVIYTFHSVAAQGWRKARLMIAGDAAHQTPPFLGQGMCAGLRDASNLAWKLNAVLKGRASDVLLDTYESERLPHVREFIALAVRLGAVIQTTDPEQARERDARFLKGVPEIFQFPAPKLGPGVLAGDHGLVGRPFPQPYLDDGRLLDEHIGLHFAVIALPSILSQVIQKNQDIWLATGMVKIPAIDRSVLAWLLEHKVQALILRPDRYIFGLATSAQDLDQISLLLPSADIQFA